MHLLSRSCRLMVTMLLSFQQNYFTHQLICVQKADHPSCIHWPERASAPPRTAYCYIVVICHILQNLLLMDHYVFATIITLFLPSCFFTFYNFLSQDAHRHPPGENCMPDFNVHYSFCHLHRIRKKLSSSHLLILRVKV